MQKLIWFFLPRNEQEPPFYSAVALFIRFVFTVTLFWLFYLATINKFDGFLILRVGAYINVFPKEYAAAGYDPGQFPFIYKAIAYFGSVVEFLFPVMFILGLFSRFAALGMIGLTAAITYIDIYGHEVALGAWFDSTVNDLLADTRMYWLVMFVVVLAYGGGKISLDYLLARLLKR